jgi:hypothetical protein
MVILDELSYAQNLLFGSTPPTISGNDLVILSKYYKYMGQNKKEIENNLKSYCHKLDPYFNDCMFEDYLKRSISISEKHELKLPKEIPITINEISKIKELKNFRYEKVVFILLAVSKFLNNGVSEYYINYGFNSMLRMAHTNQKKGENIAKYLLDLGYIMPIDGRYNTAYKIVFTNPSENSDIAFQILDINNILFYYPFYCEKCGKQIEKKSNNHKICTDCRKEYDRERQH